ncbi:MAG: hypothetical protein JXR19_09870 [Bacteroidia bacterium]
MKPFIMLVAAMFMASSAFAQIEISLGTGYLMNSFMSTTDNFNPNDVGNQGFAVGKKVTGDAAAPDVESIYFSSGGGIPINLGIGIPIVEHVMFNADFCYLMGPAVTVGETDVSADLGPLGTLTIEGTATAQSTQIRFNPGLTFSAENGLYARTGLIIPIGGKTIKTVDLKASGPTGDVTRNIEVETAGKFSMGAQTAVGYAVALADNMKLGFELQAIALNIQSSSEMITSYEDSDGVDLETAFPTVMERETNFVDAMDASSNNPGFNPSVDTSKPMDNWANRSSFGAWGFNVNFIYVIGG